MSSRVLPFLTSLLLVAACRAPTAEVPVTGMHAIQLVESTSGYRFDQATIDSASVTGDTLRLRLTYGGGCSTHEFALLQSGAFLESYPVQVYVALAHDANGDLCRALLSSPERFDLTALKRRYRQSYRVDSGTVVMHIRAPGGDAAVTTVRYTF